MADPMAGPNITKDPQFLKEQAQAAAIGKYAVYRYTYMAVSQRDDYYLMVKNDHLWEHLKIIQNTISGYMQSYMQHIVNMPGYKRLAAENPSEARELLDKRMDFEEERIGKLWICVKNPYNLREFCRWRTIADPAIKTKITKPKEWKLKDENDIHMIYSFNKYGEYNMAKVDNGELIYPLEQLYKQIYHNIRMLEDESLSDSERAEFLHDRREFEDKVYEFMKMRERIEKSYHNMRK